MPESQDPNIDQHFSQSSPQAGQPAEPAASTQQPAAPQQPQMPFPPPTQMPMWPPYVQQQYPVPPMFPYMPYPPYVKPKVPGRGFGISSMVLGIIGFFYAIIFLSLVSNFLILNNYLQSELADSIGGYIFIISVLGVLAVIFGVCSRLRGNRKGQNIAGLILGAVSLIMLMFGIIMVAVI